MMKILAFLAFFLTALFSHGLFYSVHEGKAIIINANFSEKIPAAYAQIIIYEGDSAIPLLTSRADSDGNFAFLPPKQGVYRVKVVASSDHGDHTIEFELNSDKELGLQEYKQPIYEKYIGILSAIGIIFGLFGVLSLIKSRRQN